MPSPKLGAGSYKKDDRNGGALTELGGEGRDNRVALGDPVLGDPHLLLCEGPPIYVFFLKGISPDLGGW